jgi:aminomethyltransferase
MNDVPLLRTPLFDAHVALGGKVIPFAGWEMPVQYQGIVQEHHAVRKTVGVFDISHMGQFIVSGPAALDFLNQALTNDLAKLEQGQGQYTLMLNENGGVIDDLLAYRIGRDEYFLVINASKIDEDWQHLSQLKEARHSEDPLLMRNISDATAGLAIQGPKSRMVFEQVFGPEAPYPERNQVSLSMTEAGFMWLCGTGYTGEDGFEFFMPANEAEAWFQRFVEAARALDGGPCGLGARDTLRLEMGYPLNGNDLHPDKTPLEAGLGFFVALDKPHFVGRTRLLEQKAAGLPSKLVGFKMIGTAPPPRPHYHILHEGNPVGEVASGTLSPSLSTGIGMAYLPEAVAKVGTVIDIEIRGRLFPAEIVKKPFYRRLI